MKTLIKALLAASMLMPVAVQAQEAGDRGPGRRGGGEWRAPRGEQGGPQRAADVGVDAQIRAERPQWRGQRPDGGRPQWRGERPQPQQQAPSPGMEARAGFGQDRGPGDRRPDWQRPDRPQPVGEDGRPGWDGRGGDGRGWDRGRDRDRGQQRDWQQGDGQARNWAQRDQRSGDQRGWNQGGWDQRGDQRRWADDRARPQGVWNRGGDRGWTDRGGYDRRNGWDRQWRNDGRYDWSRYRALNRGAYRLPRYYAPSGWGYGYRRFGIGVSLAPVLFSQSYWIDDPFAYRLPEAYGPYRWVRYYDDALLVDIRTGQVVDTIYDIFF